MNDVGVKGAMARVQITEGRMGVSVCRAELVRYERAEDTMGKVENGWRMCSYRRYRKGNDSAACGKVLIWSSGTTFAYFVVEIGRRLDSGTDSVTLRAVICEAGGVFDTIR